MNEETRDKIVKELEKELVLATEHYEAGYNQAIQDAIIIVKDN